MKITKTTTETKGIFRTKLESQATLEITAQELAAHPELGLLVQGATPLLRDDVEQPQREARGLDDAWEALLGRDQQRRLRSSGE